MTTWAAFNRFRKTKACPALYSVVTLRERVFKFAFFLAFPCGVVAGLLQFLENNYRYGGTGDDIDNGTMETILSNAAYGSFTFLLSMLTVFRTSQSYARYWEAADSLYQIGSDLFDVIASIFSFCNMSDVSVENQAAFQQLLLRLFSVLHALIMTELAGDKELEDKDRAQRFHLIEYDGLDVAARTALAESPCKVDLVFQWVQSLLVQAVRDKVVGVPPPILTRAFQELNGAMGHFHRCLKIAESPFPFPYTAASEMILLTHWIITPFVAATWTQWVSSAFVLAFLQVFMVCSLHAIAAELENPFEGEEHDLDTIGMQAVFNARLMQLLIHTSTPMPKLRVPAELDPLVLQNWRTDHSLLALNGEVEPDLNTTISMVGASKEHHMMPGPIMHRVQSRVIVHRALSTSVTVQTTVQQAAARAGSAMHKTSRGLLGVGADPPATRTPRSAPDSTESPSGRRSRGAPGRQESPDRSDDSHVRGNVAETDGMPEPIRSSSAPPRPSLKAAL